MPRITDFLVIAGYTIVYFLHLHLHLLISLSAHSHLSHLNLYRSVFDLSEGTIFCQ